MLAGVPQPGAGCCQGLGPAATLDITAGRQAAIMALSKIPQDSQDGAVWLVLITYRYQDGCIWAVMVRRQMTLDNT